MTHPAAPSSPDRSTATTGAMAAATATATVATPTAANAADAATSEAAPFTQPPLPMQGHAAPSVWAPPQLSGRWWPVFLRNLLVWRKLAVPSLVGNIAEPLMWLVAFGYGMGALIGGVEVNGTRVPYILFLASGSICMSAMNAASFEALYSAFSRMHVQKTWDGILNAPVGLDNIVLAEMLWAAFKAIFTATAILGVMLALGISHSTYYFTLVLTPMMFLSGVFFPREQLPPLVRTISDWLPLTNAIELVRPMFMDQWPAEPLRPVLVMLGTTVLAFWLALVLTRRRFAG